MSDLVRERILLDPRAFSTANVHRTPGVHMTDVMRDIDLVMMGRDKYKGSKLTREDLDDFALQGYLWEDAMTETLRNRVIRSNGAAIGIQDYCRLPEIACNGRDAFFIDEAFRALPAETQRLLLIGYLLLTPDGLGLTPTRLIECKWTTKSANLQPERDKREWFTQVKGYLFALSIVYRQPIFDVEWHIHFSRGEYKGGEPPIYERWTKTFEPTEVYAGWQMIMSQIEWRLNGDPATGGGTDPNGWRQYWQEAA